LEIEQPSKIFGISGICNILVAIKTAKYYELTEKGNIFTMATDNFDRYYSVMDQITEMFGPLTTTEAAVRFNSIFKGVKLDYIEEGTMMNKRRWHNLKYYTWVEQ
jgi:cysteine synthase